ncbi:unnamed protein product [Parnassius apollo]|uniref:(apollo) hypothetical protein n=1 Tax=Parnassius apollo TaxID=110799 RepID=A0A8S3Y5K1_PARAO|nr:unnamed protein product [Parnassius apollo]
MTLATKKMSRAKKMIEAACNRSNQNDIIFLTKESIENMPVILASGSSIIDTPVDVAATSNAITELVMEMQPLADGALTSDAFTEVIMEMEPIAYGSSLCSRPLISVTEECMESSGPATTSQATPRYDNNATCIDNYLSDESDSLQLVPYSEHSDSNSEEEPRGEDDRKVIYERFWGMTWGEKKIFVNSLVQEIPTKRPRDRKDPSISKRKSSMIYNLLLKDEQRVRVCKTMFQNTLYITKMTIWNWKKGKENTSHNENQNVSARKNPHEEEVESLKEFLNNIPKMESHYCHKTTSKLYLLPEWTSKRALYKFYEKYWCASRNIKPLSIAKFSNTLEIENISLFKPKKDECEKCLSHKLGNISDAELKEHIDRKNEARIEKENDKNSEELVFTMDTQAVLLAPKSNVSSLYYKTKLCTHNFCLLNLRNKDGFSYLWNETEGGLSSDNFATIIVKFITDKLLPSIHREPEKDIKIILYSDGCTAQNRNVVLANALLNVATLNNIVIEQKYLEVGHTQIEADSMHATIERKLKNKIIHVPAEYVGVCLGVRIHPKPYNVSYLSHDFFKSFGSLQYYKSIRPGKATGDAKVTDIRALQYKKREDIL